KQPQLINSLLDGNQNTLKLQTANKKNLKKKPQKQLTLNIPHPDQVAEEEVVRDFDSMEAAATRRRVGVFTPAL
ncbi:hypothetical protein ACQWE9_25070, partial [Salmonella enterica subsp. enterica serovar Infantis]